MPDSPSSSPGAASVFLLVLAGAAAYGLFWVVGRPLLPAVVQADRTAGLLPALMVTAASASLLRRQPHAVAWAFGLTFGVLVVFTGLMHLMH